MEWSEVINNPLLQNLPFKIELNNIEKYGFETPYRRAPEICVEVVSPSNSKEEITQKVELYLAKGAAEVWVVTVEKKISYFDSTGEIEKSNLVKSIKL
jgi:Uma2 family endonuclease